MVFRALSSSLNLKLLNLNYSDTKEKIMITLKVKLLRTSVKDRPTNQPASAMSKHEEANVFQPKQCQLLVFVADIRAKTCAYTQTETFIEI